MKRALLLLVLCACSLRAPRNESGSSSCTTANQCHSAPSSLSVVSVEVRPGNETSLGITQAANLDLRASTEHDFLLIQSFTELGLVTQLQNDGSAAPVPSATVVFTDHAPIIRDRVQQIRAQTDNAGVFTARLPSGSWDVLVQPPPPLPPFRLPQPFSTTTNLQTLTLPAPASLVAVQGTITAPAADLSGASVAAVDGAGNSLSAAAIVGADGGYSLLLPPGTSSYFLEVGAPSPADAGVTPGGGVPANLATLPSYDKLPGLSDVVLSLPPVATLSGSVASAAGTPLPNVAVFARSTADDPWTLARSTVTDSSGKFSLQLRAGTYVVEAAPSNADDQPATSPIQTVTVPAAGASVALVCPPKVRRSILVLAPNGTPVGANFQIAATRAPDALLISRTAVTSSTGPDGSASITGDPGKYRVQVVPPTGSSFPVRITDLLLSPSGNASDVAILQIQPALVVSGHAHALQSHRDVPVFAAVSFFTTDPTTGSSVLLCSTTSDLGGDYSCVLPDGPTP